MVVFSIRRGLEVGSGLQDDKSGIIISTVEVQLFLETEDGSIGNVDSIQEGKEVEQTEDRDDSKVDLVHHLPLVDVGEANFVRDVLSRRRGQRVPMGLLL